jgi:hypothetical protein
MAKIKVTGYLYPEPDELDESDPSGLTEEAFENYTEAFLSLDDIRFELQKE